MTLMEDPLEENCSGIQALFSVLLDEQVSLDSEERMAEPLKTRVQEHFKRCPACMEAYLHLLQSHHEVAHLALTTPIPQELDSVWSTLQGKLAEDRLNPPDCIYDEEYVSAYFDAELTDTDDDAERFESHLPSCRPCNELLADLGDASEALKQFGYRLEGSAETYLDSIGLTDAVMRTYRQEMGLPSPGECAEYTPETVSAFYDQELGTKENMVFSQHLEQCSVCRSYLNIFDRLTLGVQGYLAQWNEADIPDVWPEIQQEVSESLKKGQLLSFPSRYFKGKKALWSIPATAAAVLLIFQIGMHFHQMTGMSAMQNQMKAESSLLADGEVANNEVAWMPQSGFGGALPAAKESVAPGAGAPSMDNRSASIEQSVTRRRDLASADSVELEVDDRVPSSEEYLFRANSQDLPSEDLSVVLGAPPNR